MASSTRTHQSIKDMATQGQGIEGIFGRVQDAQRGSGGRGDRSRGCSVRNYWYRTNSYFINIMDGQ